MLTHERKAGIKIEAGVLFGKCLRIAQDKAQGYVDPHDLLPLPLDILAKDVLHVEIVEEDQIPNGGAPAGNVRTLGLSDPTHNRVLVGSLRSGEQRFSLAHELGHIVLHPGECRHRERPKAGKQFASSQDRQSEEEAERFAAKLLMPEELLVELFLDRFRWRVAADAIDEDDAYALTGRQMSPSKLRQMPRRELAEIFARSNWFKGRPFDPLVQKFGVSAKAMARELVELRLVS